MRERLRLWLRPAAFAAAAVVVVALCVVYYRHDPSEGGLKCTFKLLTGLDCPGCGSQRAFHAILHGRWAEAWGFNPFVFFAAPLGAFYFVVEGGRRLWPRFYAAAVHPALLIFYFIAIMAYWIGRNII